LRCRDAEQAAEAAQGARGAGGGGDDGGGGRVAQGGFELAGIGGGFMAEGVDQPGAAARDVGWGRAALAGGAGRCGQGRAGQRQPAGGEVAEQGGDALAGAGEAGPDGEGEVAQDTEAGGNEEDEGGENGVEMAREGGRRVGGGVVGLWRVGP